MEIKKLLTTVDHTNLNVCATWEGIRKLCDEAIDFRTASVCVAPAYVSHAKRYINNTSSDYKPMVCTVIGFPNGYSTTKVKCFEAQCAIADGADEIDMVINVGFVKNRDYNSLLHEINEIKAVCGDKILKVIIETCLLTHEEIVALCEIISLSDADYIKTSTGFSTGGATPEDIKTMKSYMKNGKKIKAAGGIKTLEDAQLFIELGADRLGTSRIVSLVKNTQKGVNDNAY